MTKIACTITALMASVVLSQNLTGNLWSEVRRGIKVNFRSALWSGSQYLAIGDDGIVYTSSNGSKWSSTFYGPKVTTMRILQKGTTYFTAGTNGIYTSTDIQTWTQVLSSSDIIFDIAWHNDTMIAVGDNGSIYRSVNGTVWQSVQSGTSGRIYSVVYALGSFYAVGNDSIKVSTNGLSWKSISKPRSYIYSIASNGKSLVVAGGQVPAYSLDSGKSWKAINGVWGDIQNYATWNGQQYLISSWDGSINYIKDDSLSTRSKTPSSGDFKAIAHNSTSSIMVGLDGRSAYTDNSNEWKTGYPWQSNISYANGRWFIISDKNTIYLSENGKEWFPILTPQHSIRKIIAAGKKFLAIDSDTSFASSSDGITWTTDTANKEWFVEDITEFHGEYYAVGRGGLLLKSADGNKWAKTKAFTKEYLSKIISVNGHLIACGDSIFVSSNGSDWEKANVELDDGSTFGSAIYNGTSYFASSGARLFTSSDALTWTIPDPFNLPYLSSLTWNGKEIIAYEGTDQILKKSVNGSVWSQVSHVPEYIHSIASCDTMMVGIGYFGTIYTSKGVKFTSVARYSTLTQETTKSFDVQGSRIQATHKRKINIKPQYPFNKP